MKHRLKIELPDYWHVRCKTKKFEIRQNEQNFRLGDVLILQPIDENNENVSEPCLQCSIVYLSNFKIDKDYIILGIDAVKLLSNS